MTHEEQLAEINRREAQVLANRKPAYRKFAKMCLAQIDRERAELYRVYDRHGKSVLVTVPDNE